jgi:hypothetical protein
VSRRKTTQGKATKRTVSCRSCGRRPALPGSLGFCERCAPPPPTGQQMKAAAWRHAIGKP